MKTSVIIPTFARPALLEKCLLSLFGQTQLPDECILVTIENDTETKDAIKRVAQANGQDARIKIITVTERNIVRAENEGLKAAHGEIVCFIDDDATAPDNWIKDIVSHFAADPLIGGVGGPVINMVNNKPLIEYTNVFARVTWFGKRITNSTKIPQKALYTDLLRGANMSFRRKLLTGFDENLLPYWRRFEDDACYYIRKLGYRLLCDPRLAVLHAEKKSPYDTQVDRTPETIIGLHHNSTYVTLKHCRGIYKIVAFLFEFVWGDDTSPGLVPLFAMAIKYRERTSLTTLRYALAGKLRGVWTYTKFLSKLRGERKITQAP